MKSSNDNFILEKEKQIAELKAEIETRLAPTPYPFITTIPVFPPFGCLIY